MKKSEVYSDVVDIVCGICEIRRSTLISGSRMQAVVDARILCVQYLRRVGMNFEEIALYMMREHDNDSSECPPLSELRKKSKGLRKMFCNYSLRCLDSRMFQILSVEIQRAIKEKYLPGN